MQMDMRRISLFLLLICLHLITSAQTPKKIKLVKADAIEYDERLVKAQRVVGSVVFEHEGTSMLCDSAWLYEEDNRLKAFGKIRITDPKGMSLTGDELDYDGNERLAEIRKNVLLKDGDMTLTTDMVQYKLEERVASYFGGGRIISLANKNILTSKSGFYFASEKVFHFKKDVELKNPRYTMFTDTLHYHSFNEQAYLLGPTTIISDQNKIYCENGWYDTKSDRARFGENAKIWTAEQILSSDSLYYDRTKGLGEAFRNVLIEDTINKIQIRGDYGRYLEFKDESYVAGRALMEQFFLKDTLTMHADTLRMLPDSLDKRRILAYYGVRMFKPDMQGVCDSLSYSEADSTMSMFFEPVLWSEDNQISGTQIDLLAYEGNIKKIFIPEKSFIISQVDSAHYNQIKGREMIGTFAENELRIVSVDGNGEAVYYATEESEDTTGIAPIEIIGVNKGACSNIVIYIKDREIHRVNFITKPENKFFPLDKIAAEELILKDFKWINDERPLSADDLFQVK
jgi:lipopolysaccharide export system protein LptA